MLSHNRDIAAQLVLKMIEQTEESPMARIEEDAQRVAEAYEAILKALEDQCTVVAGNKSCF